MTGAIRAAALDAGAEGGQIDNHWQGSQVAHQGTSPVNYRRLVESASLGMLAEALADPSDLLGFIVDEFADDGLGSAPAVWFRCPRCNERPSASVGNAHARPDGIYWRCSNRLECGASGTRFELERLVLERAAALQWLNRAVSS